MENYTKHIDEVLAKRGLMLTDEAKAYFYTYVLCGIEVKIPDHFLKELNA
jgi:hypothetical protein